MESESSETWIQSRRRAGFFDGIVQQEVSIAGQIGKVPIFYQEARAISAIFPASIRRLRRILPESYRPVRIFPGVGLVSVSALEYRECDIRPYNELSIAVLLGPDGILRQYRSRRFHAYIHYLPVTTEIALRGGIDFYGFPKFLAGLDWADSDTELGCRFSEKGEPVLSLFGRKLDTRPGGRMTFHARTWMDGRPQGTEFRIQAREEAVSWRGNHARLELSERHPIAKEMAELLLSRRPILYMYVPSFQAILFGPEQVSASLLSTLLRSLPQPETVR